METENNTVDSTQNDLDSSECDLSNSIDDKGTTNQLIDEQIDEGHINSSSSLKESSNQDINVSNSINESSDHANDNSNVTSDLNSLNETEKCMEDNTNGSNVEDQGDTAAKSASKRRLSVITISDTDSENSSDVCLVDTYQASASEAKRIRRGYSSSDSDSVSSEEEVLSDPENPTILVCKSPSDWSKSLSSLGRRAPRESVATVNSCFQDKTLSQSIAQNWTNLENFETTNVSLTVEPFRICILNKFLEDPDFVNNIIDDMTTLDWSRRKMDLYEFYRSSDLVNLSWQRAIKSFYDLLKDHIMNWISEITNLKLTHVSASCALYGPGDHLLVHDDLMNDRKVAFIYYISPWNVTSASGQSDEANTQVVQWTDAMGGALQMLTTDDKGLPTIITKSIYPTNNTFAFFKVGSNTFHQVSEVLTYDYPRLSINGWFHGPPEETEPPPQHVEVIYPIPYKDLKEQPHSLLSQSSLSKWITSNYLSPRTKYKIQQQIESTSEISLEDFFLNQLYENVLVDLNNSESVWDWQGPAHLKHYETLNLEKAGQNVKDLHSLFSCDHFLKLLSEFTDLRLSSYHSLEIQRWRAGSYTVIPPIDHSLVTELDIILYLGVPERKLCGASTIYLAPEEEESIPLITIEPLNNSLNIVYSDAGTTRFTKYVNKLGFNDNAYFYIVTCSYRE